MKHKSRMFNLAAWGFILGANAVNIRDAYTSGMTQNVPGYALMIGIGVMMLGLVAKGLNQDIEIDNYIRAKAWLEELFPAQEVKFDGTISGTNNIREID